jgi:hypothetical protein
MVPPRMLSILLEASSGRSRRRIPRGSRRADRLGFVALRPGLGPSTHARGLRRAERQSSDLPPDALLQPRSLAERDHRHQRNLLQYQQARHTQLPSPPALRVIRTAPATTAVSLIITSDPDVSETRDQIVGEPWSQCLDVRSITLSGQRSHLAYIEEVARGGASIRGTSPRHAPARDVFRR